MSNLAKSVLLVTITVCLTSQMYITIVWFDRQMVCLPPNWAINAECAICLILLWHPITLHIWTAAAVTGTLLPSKHTQIKYLAQDSAQWLHKSIILTSQCFLALLAVRPVLIWKMLQRVHEELASFQNATRQGERLYLVVCHCRIFSVS